ncbi:O-antigen ligase family protein [Salinibacterium sp. ZJ77]|uniref:O-antigen ligase family protein n=1 Tax=Salinibacterium sp. ZJ77 TaxID=2708337 RepID=UPI001421EE8B|nr:O-antigen ligase family protein [Salinibacterium sp. ZJ77]
MNGASRYQRTIATLGFFSLAAGDAWRNLLGWWGWAAVVALLLAAMIVELVRIRVDVRRIPPTLGAFLLLAAASTAWSAYPGATGLGAASTIATAVGALFYAACLSWREILESLSTAIRWILGLSFLFEFIVSAIIRRPVLPLWVDWSDLDRIPMAFYWSRDLLFDGGRIQGIVGNANILAMVALLGLIVFLTRLAGHEGGRAWGWFWVVVAIAALTLAGSATVAVTATAVAAVAALLLAVRRAPSRVRRIVLATGTTVLVAGAAAAWFARDALLPLLGRSADLTNRIEIWTAVADLAAQRPVAGWGWVSYWAPWVEPFRDLVTINGVTYLQAHNAWLDVYLQLGWIGVAVFATLVLGALLRAWNAAVDEPDPRMGEADPSWPLAAAPLLLLVAVLVQSLAESRLIIEIGFAILCIVAIGTLPRRPRRPSASGSSSPAGER